MGTAAKAKAALGRGDIYGKTGTTNDSIDAWFAGFHPSLAAVVWMGYDNPKPLGSSNAETGGGLSLPIWISYMQHALKGVPIAELNTPEGVSRASGDWEYTEFAGGGIRSLGMEDYVPSEGEASINTPKSLNESEKRSILDLFKP